jgi:hypothetical protein
MNNPTEQELLKRLYVILEELNLKNEPVLTTVVNPTTKAQHTELRNQYKTVVKTFKTFDYNRKVHELIALEARLDFEKANKESEVKDDTISSVDS